MPIFHGGESVGKDKNIIIKSLLGEGGQGEVYLVEKDGEKYALKIYKQKMSDDFRYNLKTNVKNGSPSKVFLWPMEVIDFDDGSLGYIMDLRPENYVSFVSLLTGKNAFANQSLLLHWCIELCMAFKLLHERAIRTRI